MTYEQLSGGKLRKVAERRTNARGLAHMNVAGLGEGKRFIVKAAYYDRRLTAGPVTRAGRVRFNITSDGSRMRDREPPKLNFTNTSGNIDPRGFKISGRAWDDSKVRRVVVIVDDAALGRTRKVARLNKRTGRWSANFGRGVASRGQTVNVIARAIDSRGKRHTERVQRQVGGKPGGGTAIKLLKPQADSTVSEEGFSIVAQIRRPRSMKRILVSVEDSTLGTTIDKKRVKANRKARIRVDVPADKVTSGGTAMVTIMAIDRKGVESIEQFSVRVGESDGGGGGGGTDTTNPEIAITSPADGSAVSGDGFPVTGTASDESGIKSVSVMLNSPTREASTAIPATIDAEAGTWSAMIPGDALVANSSISLSATATDKADNSTTSTVALTVDPDADSTGPEIIPANPGEAAVVAVEGFDITGSVSDPSGVASLYVSVLAADNSERLRATAVSVNDTGAFAVAVPGTGLVSGEALRIVYNATDGAGNTSTRTTNVTVAEADNGGPEITLTSPGENSNVGVSGFTLAGRMIDSGGVSAGSFAISRDGSTLIETTALEQSEDGSFSTDVALTGVSDAEVLTITLNASDEGGNDATRNVTVTATAQRPLQASQLISRATFGATPDLLESVSASGAQNWLDEQLNPTSVDDSAFESFIQSIRVDDDINELRKYVLLHMISSRRQLNEVMTQFWDNHFNTHVHSRSGDFRNSAEFEKEQNDMFRANALGNFGNILEMTAKSPSMLIFLDSVVNKRRDANENYARELLELHTIGVDGGYTQEDIEAAAEIFTGWHMRSDEFSFDEDEHNSDAQTFLGQEIAEGQVEQGEALLRQLVRHPATANFICFKLAQVFVNDQPAQNVVATCADVFSGNIDAPDQLALVVRSLIESPEFAAGAGSKIKTPLEFMTSTIRGLTASSDGSDLASLSYNLDMRPFDMPVPTGWSELGDDWMNTIQFISRVKWAHKLSQRRASDSRTGFDPASWVTARGLTTSTQITDYLIRLFLAGEATEQERQSIQEILDGESPLDLNDREGETRVRTAVGLVLSLPGFNFQ